MEKIKVANKYQKSIDLLNDALGKEIATSLQYMYFMSISKMPVTSIFPKRCG